MSRVGGFCTALLARRYRGDRRVFTCSSVTVKFCPLWNGSLTTLRHRFAICPQHHQPTTSQVPNLDSIHNPDQVYQLQKVKMPLSTKQMEYLALAWQCFESEPKVCAISSLSPSLANLSNQSDKPHTQIDYNKFYQVAGLKSAHSAREVIYCPPPK